MFEDLENDIININESDLPVCLLGDFNSRTSTMADYNTFDTNLVEVLSNNCNIYDEVLKADLIYQYNIDLNRTSSDNVCNAFGMKLLHLCKTFDLYIGNGRLGCDRGIGKPTNNRDKSVIDYVLFSPNLIHQVYNFEILNYDPVLSDIHSAIRVVFKCNSYIENVVNHDSSFIRSTTVTKATWNIKEKGNFQRYLNSQSDKIKEIENEISNLFTDQTSKEQVNKVVCDISYILTDSAGSCDLIKTFKIKHGNRMKEKYDKKVWFNADCKMLRENYLKAKYNYRCDKCNENEVKLKSASKLYKKTINKAHNKYIKDQQDKMRKLNVNDSSGFWKLINNSGKIKMMYKIVELLVLLINL